MSNHLTREEIAAVVAGLDLEAPSREHLESCVACRAEAANLEELIRARRDGMLDHAPDWDDQMRRVMDRLPVPAVTGRRRPSRWLRPLLAAAAMATVAVGLGILRTDPPVEPVAGEPSVEEILAEMDELLSDDSIPGFEIIDPETNDLETYFNNGAS